MDDIFITLLVFHLNISDTFSKLMHPLNKELILVIFSVLQYDNSVRVINEIQFLNILDILVIFFLIRLFMSEIFNKVEQSANIKLKSVKLSLNINFTINVSLFLSNSDIL